MDNYIPRNLRMTTPETSHNLIKKRGVAVYELFALLHNDVESELQIGENIISKPPWFKCLAAD